MFLFIHRLKTYYVPEVRSRSIVVGSRLLRSRYKFMSSFVMSEFTMTVKMIESLISLSVNALTYQVSYTAVSLWHDMMWNKVKYCQSVPHQLVSILLRWELLQTTQDGCTTDTMYTDRMLHKPWMLWNRRETRLTRFLSWLSGIWNILLTCLGLHPVNRWGDLHSDPVPHKLFFHRDALYSSR